MKALFLLSAAIAVAVLVGLLLPVPQGERPLGRPVIEMVELGRR